MNIFLQLFLSFFKIGSLTFGGGIAMLPMLQLELIEKRKWVTENEILDYYAVGQSTPGIIAVNVATFVGFKKGKIFGGILATLGIILPGVIIITILAGLINSINEYPVVQKAMKGINIAVCALIVDAYGNFAKKISKGFVSILLMLLSFALIYYFNVPSYYIILGTIVLSLLIYFILKKTGFFKRKEQTESELKKESEINSDLEVSEADNDRN